MLKETYFCDWCGTEITELGYNFTTTRATFGLLCKLATKEFDICPSCKEKLNSLIDGIKKKKKEIEQ